VGRPEPAACTTEMVRTHRGRPGAGFSIHQSKIFDPAWVLIKSGSWLSVSGRGGPRDPVRRGDDFTRLPPDKFGPRRQDGSLDAFFSRVRQQSGDRPFGVNVHALQLADPDLWMRFRAFVGALTRHTRTLPTQRWELDTFFGTYPMSPLGVHRDNASVFALGVVGRRTYYTWPAEYFQPGDRALHKPDRAVVEPHLPHATRMDAAPGDLVYWPSSHWHLATSSGEPSAVVQVSAYFGRRVSDLMAEMVRRIVAERLGPSDHLLEYPLAEDRADLPAVLADACDAAARAAADGKLARRMRRFWLNRVSADGFDVIAPLQADAELDDDDAVSLAVPITWSETAPGHCVVAANGHSMSAGGAKPLLERLAAGETVRVADADESQRSVLRFLLRARAVRKELR